MTRKNSIESFTVDAKCAVPRVVLRDRNAPGPPVLAQLRPVVASPLEFGFQRKSQVGGGDAAHGVHHLRLLLFLHLQVQTPLGPVLNPALVQGGEVVDHTCHVLSKLGMRVDEVGRSEVPEGDHSSKGRHETTLDPEEESFCVCLKRLI